MEFKDKYTVNAGEVFKTKDAEGKNIEIPKMQVSNDAFAVGEMIQNLIFEIGRQK